MLDFIEIDDSVDKYARLAFFGPHVKAISYGMYCVLFVLYVYLLRRRCTAETSALALPLTALFILCTISEAIDIAVQYLLMFPEADPMIRWNLNVVGTGLYTIIDLLCQGILIYRCWIMWDGRPIVTVIPSILALVSLASGVTVVGGLVSASVTKQIQSMSPWWSSLWIASYCLSMAVSFILTGLLVLKIFLLHKSISETPGHVSHIPLGRIITGLIESGAILFIFQVLYLVIFCFGSASFDRDSTPCSMLYGITPTFLYVNIALRNIVNPVGINRLPTELYFANPGTLDLRNLDHSSQDTSSIEEKANEAQCQAADV